MKNHELFGKLKVLVERERRITAQVIGLLEEVNYRKSFVELGYNSMLDYCVKELKYSETAARRRLSAMKMARKIPEVKGEIEKGTLNLSQLSMAQNLFDQNYVEPDKRIELIEVMKNLSVLESEKKIREELKLPPRPKYVRIEVSDATKAKWNEVRARMVHKGLSDQDLLNDLLDLKLKQLKKPSKCTAAPMGKGRFRPAPLDLMVKDRGQHRCEWPGCKSAYALEVDHIIPFAQGGETRAYNLQLLCKNHNLYRARQMSR